jgi:hypothetical protein
MEQLQQEIEHQLELGATSHVKSIGSWQQMLYKKLNYYMSSKELRAEVSKFAIRWEIFHSLS